MWDGGADPAIDFVVMKGDKKFKKERGKIERFFAMVVQKFKSFCAGSQLAQKTLMKRWKCALILLLLDELAKDVVRKRQDKMRKLDIVTVFSDC